MGINIKIREDKKIDIETKGQLEEGIEALQQEIGSALMSPAERNILTVYKHCDQLSEKKSEIFHYVTAKFYILLIGIDYI